MTALATIPTLPLSATTAAPAPLVLLDGAPVSWLAVRQLSLAGRADHRTAVLTADTDAVAQRAAGCRATLVLPLRLCDGQSRQPVLADGRLTRRRRSLSNTRHQVLLELTDAWSAALDRPLEQAWWQHGEDQAARLLAQKPPAVMGVGDQANRSSIPWRVGDAEVHVFQQPGRRWTLGQALSTLNALAALGLDLRLLPRNIGEQPLARPVNLARTIGAALAQLLAEGDLFVARELWRESGRLVERRGLRAGRHGRRVVPGTATVLPSPTLGVEERAGAGGAQAWIAQADGWVVESTFTLVHGWDPAQEGRPDGDYHRDSPGFADRANVYRLWVLNEDGLFTPPPFNQGPAFDLAALFEVPTLAPRVLAFLPCLALDDAGLRRTPLVQVSTDGGASWSGWSGSVELWTERAAVYLGDAGLPPAFLAAAKAGTAKVRITASLRCPLPVQVRRWRGNAFAGTRPAVVLDLGSALGFRRITPASLHADAVRAGTLAADLADDRPALHRWLVERMDRAGRDVAPPDHAEQATSLRLELAGVWPLLRCGDRLGPIPADAPRPALPGGTVAKVECAWPEDRTGPRTRVWVE